MKVLGKLSANSSKVYLPTSAIAAQESPKEGEHLLEHSRFSFVANGMLSMDDQPKPTRRPICGALSVFAPLIGGAVGVIASLSEMGKTEMWQLAPLPFVFGALPCGLILAFCASFRHERYGFLRWWGLFLNGLPLFLYLVMVTFSRA